MKRALRAARKRRIARAVALGCLLYLTIWGAVTAVALVAGILGG